MNIAQFREHWRDWLMLVLGAWLLVSPFILGFTGAEAMMVLWNSVIVGVVVAVLAIAVLRKTYVWEEWLLLALGAWLIVSPFLLGFAGLSGALWNSVIVGLLVGADSIWSLVVMLSHHGHETA